MNTCPSIITHHKRRGEVCGKPVKAFVARGHGRCAYHATDRERIRVVAVIRAEREMRELRLVEPDKGKAEQEREPSADEQSEPPASFDVQRFAGPELDD